MSIRINLDVQMAKRKIGLTELSREVDITMANLSRQSIRPAVRGILPSSWTATMMCSGI